MSDLYAGALMGKASLVLWYVSGDIGWAISAVVWALLVLVPTVAEFIRSK